MARSITHTPTGLVARCKLRDLEVGEQVVVDVQGIAPSANLNCGNSAPRNLALCQLGFPVSAAIGGRTSGMGTAPIRDHGGKVVVTAGPVVIHTGGGEHLARLIRRLCAGIAGRQCDRSPRHRTKPGDFLGRGYETGVAVRGHRHHLKVITIRRYGSIAKAGARRC